MTFDPESGPMGFDHEPAFRSVSNAYAGIHWANGDSIRVVKKPDSSVRIYNETRREVARGTEEDMRRYDPLLLDAVQRAAQSESSSEDIVNMDADAYRAMEARAASAEITRYVDKAMFEAEAMDDAMLERPRVTLLSATPDPLGALAAMNKMYKGEVVRDLADVTDDERRHEFEETFKTHLKAPWESIDFHFMVEGVTRAFTHQMVRQRTAVFAQESMRFAVKEQIQARPGPMIGGSRGHKEAWSWAVDQVWLAYKHLIANGVPAEEARGLLPHDTLTRLHYKTNLRNLAEHLGNRLCTQAQFEWRLVAAEIRRAIGEYSGFDLHPPDEDRDADSRWQFQAIANSPIFQPICFTTGKCEFRSAADRGCTIRERVDRGAFEEVRPEEWLADPTAGWVR